MRRAVVALGVVLAGMTAVACRSGVAAPAREESAETAAVAAAGELVPVADGALCTTLGMIGAAGEGGARAVGAAKVRAVAAGSHGEAAELRFVYRGPSEETAPLASGQVRRQLGLKLRAVDGCNVVYVMWRVEPKPGLQVSVKANPGASRHAACGTRGYRTLAATRAGPVPALVPGALHALRAAIDDDELVAWIDGAEVWRGPLGAEAAALRGRGPAGLRTDNVAADLELLVSPPAAAPPRCPATDLAD